MNFAAVDLKKVYFNKNPKDVKVVHVMSSGFKAMFSWHSMRTLQVRLIIFLEEKLCKRMCFAK